METIKRLKKVSTFAETSAGCFAIRKDDLGKVEDDINELLKEKMIENFYDDPEEAEENLNEYGTLWYVLTNDGIEKLKNSLDSGKLSGREYSDIIDTLGW